MSNARNAVIAGFLGWTLDAFDFFIVTLVATSVARDFNTDIVHIQAAITATLATRWIGAIVFGLLADRFGRRIPLIINILYFSLIEVLTGLAPNYRVFFWLRALYGIGMGGEWGVGASLTMESVPPRLRGVISGLLQEGYALGNLLAAAAFGLVYPHFGWRVLFFIGGAPALLTLFVRARVQEPEAWHRSRVEWREYRRTLAQNWRRFAYLVLLMAMMNFVSHGTQDMYPSYLEQQRGFSPGLRATTIMISMVGATIGGIVVGRLSDFFGRRRPMVGALLAGVLLIPLWVFAPSVSLLMLGGFLMQFMVQGAWGVIPAHVNEISPDAARGLFPGLGYQLGVLLAAASGTIEALMGRHMPYSQAMGIFAAIVFILGVLVILLGPEAHGVRFGVARPPQSSRETARQVVEAEHA